MNKKIILWLHMHQPDYLESTTGNIFVPWVRRHSLNGYYTIAKLLEQSTFKANINFSGILLEQIQRYQKGQRDVYQLYEDEEPSLLTGSEIDFIIKYEGEITPLEVKAGTHTTSRAFQNFVKKYRVKNAFLFSKKNTGVSIDGVIKHLPLYMLEIILEQEPDIF